MGLIVAYLCRGIGLRDDEETIARQQELRAWLKDVDSPSANGKKWRKVCKVIVPVWFVFAIGPGALLSSTAFSFAGFPHIWSWQIAWWIFGIIMMWALCFKAELSTETDYMLEEAEKSMLVVEQ